MESYRAASGSQSSGRRRDKPRRERIGSGGVEDARGLFSHAYRYVYIIVNGAERFLFPRDWEQWDGACGEVH